MTRSLILAAVLFCATSVASAQYGHQHHGRHMQGLTQLHQFQPYQFQPYQYQYTPVYNYSWTNTPWGGQATFRSNIPQPNFQPNFAAPAPFVPAFPMFPNNNGFNSNWSW